MSYITGAVAPLPGSLTLQQFIHDVIAGISGVSNSLVRPKWSDNPAKQPDRTVDWIAFHVEQYTSDAGAYVGVRVNGTPDVRRFEDIDVQLSVYGPNAEAITGNLRDGFEVGANREGLTAGNMGFKGMGSSRVMPDLVGEHWITRLETTLTLSRQIQRSYPIVSFLSLSGNIKANAGAKTFTVPISVPGQT